MKKLVLIGSTLLAMAVGAQAATDDHKDHDHGPAVASHTHEAKAAYGGVVSVVKDVNYELVVKPDSISLFVTDHGKAVDLAGASAKLTLLSANERHEVTLIPVGNRLEAKDPPKLGPGTKAVAQVSLRNKSTVAVRFTIK